jgi:alpha-L-fucosidase 2
MGLAPLADGILLFYDQHFERDADGRIRINPSQSLETSQNVVNPLPDIAGLKYVITRLQAQKVPLSKPAQTAARRLLHQLPDVPTTGSAGKKVLAAAERIFGQSKNTENPELYAVFPFRLYSVDTPDAEIGRNTFEARKFKRTGGWQQDAIQAAYLGLANTAQRYVIENFTARSEQPSVLGSELRLASRPDPWKRSINGIASDAGAGRRRQSVGGTSLA